MKTEKELRETLENTLSKYKTNKEKVPLEDLKGKYKTAFSKLRERLKEDTLNYLIQVSAGGLEVLKSDSDRLSEEFQKCFKECDAGRKAGVAIFNHYSIRELEQVGAELRERWYPIWEKYFFMHTCLYITDPDFQKIKEPRFEDYRDLPPEKIELYNDLMEMFWNREKKCWEERPKPEKPATLIFFSEKWAAIISNSIKKEETKA